MSNVTLKRLILLAVASFGLLSNVSANDELSLQNRLKEFNKPVTSVVKSTSSKPKTKKVSKSTSSSKKKRFVKYCYEYSTATLLRKADAYLPYIRANSRKYGVDEALIIAVMATESCFRKTARSPKSAQGLMQLIPATAKRFGVKDAYRPSQNIRGGTRYLRFLVKRFSGNLEYAVAAYNAGEGAVDRYSGIPPYRETKEYVRRVMSVYNRMKGSKGTGHASSKSRKKAVFSVQKVSNNRGNFIKPDKKWRMKDTKKVVAAVRKRQQAGLASKRASSSHSCGDSVSLNIRRSSDLIKRTKLWRRFYTVTKPVTLSAVSQQTGVALNHLLKLNHGISKKNVKMGRKVLIWQCVNH